MELGRLLSELSAEVDRGATDSTVLREALATCWRGADTATLRGVLPTVGGARLAEQIDIGLYARLHTPMGVQDVALAARGQGEMWVLAWLRSAAADPRLRIAPVIAQHVLDQRKPRQAFRDLARSRLLEGDGLDSLAAAVGMGRPGNLFKGQSEESAHFEMLIWSLGRAHVHVPELRILVLERTTEWLRWARGGLRHRALLARLLEMVSEAPESSVPRKVRLQVQNALWELSRHPHWLVWIPAARALGRLAATWVGTRRLLERLRSSDRLSDRRRAVTASCAVPPTHADLAASQVETVLEQWNDEWMVAAVGPSIAYLAIDHSESWAQLVARLGRRKPSLAIARTWGQGLIELQRRQGNTPLSEANAALLARMVARVSSGGKSDPKSEYEREAAKSALRLARGPLASMERLIRSAKVGSGANAEAALGQLSVRWNEELLASEGGRRARLMEELAEVRALAFHEPLNRALGSPMEWTDTLRQTHERLIDESLASESAVDVRAGLRCLGSLVDGGEYEPGDWLELLDRLGPLARRWRPGTKLASRCEKTLADLVQRLVTKLIEGGVPEHSAHARFSVWAALYSRDPVHWLQAVPRAGPGSADGTQVMLSSVEALRAAVLDPARRPTPQSLGALLDGVDLGDTSLGDSIIRALGTSSGVNAEGAGGTRAGCLQDDMVRQELITWGWHPIGALGGDEEVPLESDDAHFLERAVAQVPQMALPAPEHRANVPATQDLAAEPRNGQYIRVQRLAEALQGGMSEVWLVRHPRFPRHFVMKIPPQGGIPESQEAAARAALERELEALVSFYNPNVVSVVDFDFDAQPPYIVFEYLVGASLETYTLVRPLSIAEAKPIVADVASGVRAIHEAGMVHRDLKLANIYLRFARNPLPPGTDGLFRFSPEEHRDAQRWPIATAVVIDFGIAVAPWLPKFGTAYTPGFASPEQLQGEQYVGPASDVYSFAATISAALAGETYFNDSADPLLASITTHPVTEALRRRLPSPAVADLLADASDPIAAKRISLEEFTRRFAALE